MEYKLRGTNCGIQTKEYKLYGTNYHTAVLLQHLHVLQRTCRGKQLMQMQTIIKNWAGRGGGGGGGGTGEWRRGK